MRAIDNRLVAKSGALRIYGSDEESVTKIEHLLDIGDSEPLAILTLSLHEHRL
jgi:hypothetical protein